MFFVLTQTLKPVLSRSSTARLKPCPDRKHELFRSLSRHRYQRFRWKSKIPRWLKPSQTRGPIMYGRKPVTRTKIPSFLTKDGCPTSRSFSARCGIPLLFPPKVGKSNRWLRAATLFLFFRCGRTKKGTAELRDSRGELGKSSRSAVPIPLSALDLSPQHEQSFPSSSSPKKMTEIRLTRIYIRSKSKTAKGRAQRTFVARIAQFDDRAVKAPLNPGDRYAKKSLEPPATGHRDGNTP